MLKLLGLTVLILIILGFVGCSADPVPDANVDVTVLTMLFHADPVISSEMSDITNWFNKTNKERVFVELLFTSMNIERILYSMIATDDPPDIFYIPAGYFHRIASEGRLLDMGTLPGFNVGEFLPLSVWRYEGRVYGLSTFESNLFLAYDTDMFVRRGVPPPPSRFEDALDKEAFLQMAQHVTIDRNGNNALHPDFGADSIAVFGFNQGPWFNHILTMVYSAGGSLLNADRTNTVFATDPWVDTIYWLNRLIYVYRVSPTPLEAAGFPPYPFVGGAFATQIDGRESMMWLNNLRMNVGVAILPDLGHGPFTMSTPSVASIFSETEHPNLAWEFYRFKIDVRYGATELFAQGLWQPILEIWYTDPDYLAVWTDNYRHPESFFGGIVDMSLRPERNVRLPSQYIIQFEEITAIVNPALQQIWGQQMTRAEITEIMTNVQRDIEANNGFRGTFD